MTATLLVAGERLAKREATPFTNRAGMLFREMMQDANINPDRADFVYPANHEDLVRLGQDSTYLVLVGDKMLNLVHPELRIGQCHGRAMLFGGQIIFPVFHHEATARSPKDLRPVVTEELRLLRTIAVDRDNLIRYVPSTCVKCRGKGFGVTPERVAYCQQHWRAS